jgi:hypothetical protein
MWSRKWANASAIFCLSGPASIVEFDHFGASHRLLENSSMLDADTPAVNGTLCQFEQVFNAFNQLD